MRLLSNGEKRGEIALKCINNEDYYSYADNEDALKKHKTFK
jgi:hypothetical protein